MFDVLYRSWQIIKYGGDWDGNSAESRARWKQEMIDAYAGNPNIAIRVMEETYRAVEARGRYSPTQLREVRRLIEEVKQEGVRAKRN